MGWNIFDPQVGNFIDTIPAQQRVDESWYKGTADAIYQNFHVIQNDKPEYVLILAGDHIYKMNYGNMFKFHLEKNADFTIGLVRMPIEKSKELGVCEMDGDGRLVGFAEKPKHPKTIEDAPNHFYASMGIYLAKTEFLKKILTEDSQRQSQHDFGKDVIPNIYKEFKVFAYDFNKYEKYGAYWRDIGTLDAYYEANMDLVNVTPEFDLYDKQWPIRTYEEQFPPAKTVYDGSLEPSRKGEVVQSLLSQGVVVSGGKIYRSILSPNVRVNSYTTVEDSIIMEGVDVGRYSKIRRAIIDKEVRIPQHEEIGYNIEADKKRFHVTEGGITVVAKREEIGKLS